MFLPSTRSSMSMSNDLAHVCDESWRPDTKQFYRTLPDSPQPCISWDSLSEWKHQSDSKNPLTNTLKIPKPHLSGEWNLCYSLTRGAKALDVNGNRRETLHIQSFDQVKACISWSLVECGYILYVLSLQSESATQSYEKQWIYINKNSWNNLSEQNKQWIPSVEKNKTLLAQ